MLDLTKPLELNRSGYTSVEYLGLVDASDPSVGNLRATMRDGTSRSYTFRTLTGVLCGGESNDNSTRVRNASDTEISTVFTITCGKDDWDKANWQQLPLDRYEYRDAKQASAAMKELNATAKAEGSDWRFILKKRIENASSTDWRGWMGSRFDTGEYKKVIWADEEWAQKYPEHYLHNSLGDSDMIAYVQDEPHALADKFTNTTPGRYLQMYFSDILSQEDIAMWSAKFDTDTELVTGDTPEFFEEGYKAAYLGSCMGYSNAHFGGVTHHPTKIYGAGDLELALLKRRGAVVARTVLMKSKKRFIKIYGDHKRMLARLEALGYKQATSRDLEGVRLLHIKSKLESKNAVVMPYLDLGMHATFDPEDDNILRMSRRGLIYGNSHRYGRVVPGNIQNPIACGYCSNTVHEPATAPFVGGTQNRVWCQRCADAYARKCDFTNEYYYSNDGAHFPVGVYDPKSMKRVKYLSVPFAEEFADEVQLIGGQYFITKGLVFNSQTKQWSLPEKVDKPKRKAA